jgi:hypothetical protein
MIQVKKYGFERRKKTYDSSFNFRHGSINMILLNQIDRKQKLNFHQHKEILNRFIKHLHCIIFMHILASMIDSAFFSEIIFHIHL